MLAHAEDAPTELMPAPPAAPSPAVIPEQELAPGFPCPPAAELDLLVAPQQESPLELYLRAALDPHLPVPSLPDLLIIMFIATLISQSRVNDRIIIKKI